MAASNTKPVGGKPDKLIRDALKAAQRNNPDQLKRVAEKIWSLAEAGDMQAFKEIADRIDGKVAQGIVGGDEDDSPVALSLKVSWVDKPNV